MTRVRRRDGLLAMLLVIAVPCRADEPPTYERDVKPLLSRRCTVCHNAKKLGDPDISAGLALDTFEAALAGTQNHKVVVAGKAAESELFRRLTDEDEDRRMPLLDKPLSAPQVDL